MNQGLARAIVFFTSASVLVIEILAVRLLAPYVGVSLEVFTGVIGVILAGISLGAWFGGRAADHSDPRRLVGPALVLGGLAAMASPLVIDLMGPSLRPGPLSIVVASLVGFLPSAAVLSAVPPIVVKIRLSSLADTGSVVGSYSAVGTAGALVGTFATGFLLIAAFPTRPIVVALGAGLAVAGAALTGLRERWSLPAVVVALALGGVVLTVGGPCQLETAYHCVIIEADESRDSGRLLILDRVRNSYVDLQDPTYLEFRYVRLIADIVDATAPEGPLNVVSIGGGGFTLPTYFAATRPGTANTVLEIDGTLVDIGRRQLGLSPAIHAEIGDARMSIRSVGTGSADIVIGDAYSGASVPWHLTTVEFNTEIARILERDGLYVMNVIDYRERAFVRSEAGTLLRTFEHVTLLAPPEYVTGVSGGNFILVASQSPIDLAPIAARVRARGSREISLTEDRLRAFIGDARTLHDDFAPVDQILGRP